MSRQVFYKWQRRYEELGEAGLRDGSSRPLHSPNATDPEIVRKVIYLRRSYHFGPAADRDVLAAATTTWRSAVGSVAHPQTARAEPAPGVAALQTAQPALEALREATKATASKWTSSSSSRSAPSAASTTSTPRSMTAPGCGCCGSTRATTRRRPSSSSTTSWPSCRSRPSACRPTTAPSSKVPSTGTCWTGASSTSTSRTHPAGQRQGGRSQRIDVEEFYRLLDGVVIDDSGLFAEKL